MKTDKGSFLGVTPLIVFLLVYLASSILLNDFYAMPLSVAFLISACYAIALTRGLRLEERIGKFTLGASHPNILTMVWIFILAGAFSEGAKTIGAIEATTQLILGVLPTSLLLPGLFLAACLVSMSIGTSVGTIVALTPIALGFSEGLNLSPAYVSAVIAGGAFFGDNLSFISDTTIAATRTQGVGMRDKFKVNFLIVLPAALLTLGIYTFEGLSLEATPMTSSVHWALFLPYLVVIAASLCGLNVLIVLALGIASSGLIGALFAEIDFWTWIASLGTGILGMGELIIVTLLAGGLLELIRYNGGIDYILNLLTKHIQGKRGGELAIGALVMLVNVCTANNTIAILTAGAMAREVSTRYGIDPRRSASLLDTYSCVIQGLLPYGAQLLLAAGFASVSPLSMLGHLYYPIMLFVVASLAIAFRYPRRFACA